MFQNDYIMRQVHDMTKAFAKLVLHLDVNVKSEHLVQIEDAQVQETTGKLLQMIDSGNINEAENELYKMLEQRTMDNFHAGIAFYAHLEEKEDAFLDASDFSREEIQDGKSHLLTIYGLAGMEDTFFGE